MLSFRWSMPGRCMSVSIFCIQLSPMIRFWSFTNGSRPQNVTNTRQRTPLAAAVDDRISDRPDPVEVAAPVDDHELLGLDDLIDRGVDGGLGHALDVRDRGGEGSNGVVVGRSSVVGGHGCCLTSGAGRSGRRRRPRICSTSSLPVVRDQAAKSLTDPGSVARTSTRAAGPERLHRLRRLHDRHRAGQAAGVDAMRSAELAIGWPPSSLDEDDLAVAGIEEEGGDALHAVDERVEVGSVEMEQVHRQRAGLDVDAAELLGLAERLGPAGLAGEPQRVDGDPPSAPASGASPWSAAIRSARNASSAQYCRKTLTG